MNDKNDFEFSYTALSGEERKEVESIRGRYAADGGTENLTELRKLDKKAKRTPTVATAVMGTVGCLAFGGGLALTLELQKYAVGFAVSAVGIVIMVLSYFVHGFLTKKSKEKYGKRILELSEKILQGKEKGE